MQLPTFSIFYPSKSRSCYFQCFTSIIGIQPVLQLTKTLYNSIWSKNDIFLSGSFIVLTHGSQTKSFAKVVVTLFIFTHLACIHLPHFVHITEIAITFLPHLAHGSTFLRSTLPFKPHSIFLVFLRLTFIPYLFPFQKLVF